MIVALMVACGVADDDAQRTAWLVDVLYDDNRVWMSRDPALLRAKYDIMAADPYDWMRGSLGVFLSDLSRAGGDRVQTAFLDVPDAARISIVGDPHPENIGLFNPGWDPVPSDVDPVLYLEVADLDGAGFGPYLIDTRRGVLGLATLLDGAGCDKRCREPILAAWAEGYVAEIAAQASGEGVWSPGLVRGRLGVLLERALDDVVVAGNARQILLENTALTEEERRFVAMPGPVVKGLAVLTGDEDLQVERLLTALDKPAGFRRLDAARRYGIGVASLPAVRYAVLWDLGGAGDADDALLQLREVVDPPNFPGLRTTATWDDGAARIDEAAALAWSRPDIDPWLSGLADGAMTFRATSWSSYDATLDHVRIARDFGRALATPSDLLALADTLGRHLASVHARAITADGDPAFAALVADLDGRSDAFVAEHLAAGERDLSTVLRDHELFVEALAAGQVVLDPL